MYGAISHNLFFSPFRCSQGELQEKLSLIHLYLAQKKVLLETVLPKELGVDRVCVVPQYHFHLDLFLMPGPKGSVFLHDYRMSVELLQLIQEAAPILELTPTDMKILSEYLKMAIRFEKAMTPFLERAKKALESAHLTMIPTPGLFYEENTSSCLNANPILNTQNCNFMNALLGFSEKLGRHFYLSGGAKVGDKLGDILMKLFELHLKAYADLDVYFINDGEVSWNCIDAQAGLHCITAELETAPHTA